MGVGSKVIFWNPAGTAGVVDLGVAAGLAAAGFAVAGALEVEGAGASRVRLQNRSRIRSR
jgi:predicted nicotinamide N-methyase